jgi:hypothetical protein
MERRTHDHDFPVNGDVQTLAMGLDPDFFGAQRIEVLRLA